MTVVYWYPGCSTCKKAVRWLSARGVEHQTVHLVEQRPSAETLKDLWRRSGQPLKKMFNTAGKSYRAGGFKDKLPTMTDQQALDALAAAGGIQNVDRFWIVNGFSCGVTKAGLDALAEVPGVYAIEEEGRIPSIHPRRTHGRARGRRGADPDERPAATRGTRTHGPCC